MRCAETMPQNTSRDYPGTISQVVMATYTSHCHALLHRVHIVAVSSCTSCETPNQTMLSPPQVNANQAGLGETVSVMQVFICCVSQSVHTGSNPNITTLIMPTTLQAVTALQLRRHLTLPACHYAPVTTPTTAATSLWPGSSTSNHTHMHTAASACYATQLYNAAESAQLRSPHPLQRKEKVHQARNEHGVLIAAQLGLPKHPVHKHDRHLCYRCT